MQRTELIEQATSSHSSTLRISYDEDRDFLWAIPPDAVIDGQLDDEMDEPFEGLFLYRRGPDGPIFGFGVQDAFAWDVMGNSQDPSGVIWGDDLRFDVPTLALEVASIGEIVLAAQATIRGSTPDVVFFDLAVQANEEEEPEEAEGLWRTCLEGRKHEGALRTRLHAGRARACPRGLRASRDVHETHPSQLVGVALARPGGRGPR